MQRRVVERCGRRRWQSRAQHLEQSKGSGAAVASRHASRPRTTTQPTTDKAMSTGNTQFVLHVSTRCETTSCRNFIECVEGIGTPSVALHAFEPQRTVRPCFGKRLCGGRGGEQHSAARGRGDVVGFSVPFREGAVARDRFAAPDPSSFINSSIFCSYYVVRLLIELFHGSLVPLQYFLSCASRSPAARRLAQRP